MASPIPPPLFLSTPGDPPIPWADWKLIFEAYVDAIGKDAAKPERRKALLINALGYAGLKLYQTLSSANASETPASADVFQAALALFDDHFKDASCDYVARLRFQERRQLPGEPVVDFIASLRSLAASCGFGALENDMIRQQLFIGVASQNVRCRLLQKGSSITLSEALSIAREDELCSNFLLRGAMAPVLCFTGRANMAALLLRLGAAVNMAARLHIPFVAVNMAAPPLRGVEEAVKMAAQILLFKGNRERLAHFSNFRRRTAQTNTVTVLNVDGLHTSEPRVTASVGNVPLSFMVDTGASVSLINADDFQHSFPHIQLARSSTVLHSYSKGIIRHFGQFTANVKYAGVQAPITFFVTPCGRSLLGLDAIRLFGITICGDTLQCYSSKSKTTLPVPNGTMPATLSSAPAPSASSIVSTVRASPTSGPTSSAPSTASPPTASETSSSSMPDRLVNVCASPGAVCPVRVPVLRCPSDVHPPAVPVAVRAPVLRSTSPMRPPARAAPPVPRHSACRTLPSPGGEDLPSACDQGAESPPSTHQRRRTKRKRRKPRRYEDYVQ
ncbi:hypothetical protein HPB52_017158 [Rhipicephalus sanguineus]|uniref:Retropepsins domain-containing protein n=1 Tax=Rhipicephalus sanguineus TaxID=34632 RepID=A0A9D4PQH4_RHISA|nr:hypothetical protein HPB52_017158 [Rhipicephalus sanguineus]